jgi:hypothetical protein
MAVPAAKVKEICTAQEAALVQASRKPDVDQLTPAELKQHIGRARQLYDKWLALSRSQARASGKKVGFGESKPNTELKSKAFGDAIKAFEDQLAKQSGSTVPKTKVAQKKIVQKKVAKTKQMRSDGHRVSRAEVRAELSAVKESLKEPARKAAKKKAAKKVAAQKLPAAAAAPVEKKAKKTAKKTPPAISPMGNLGLGLDKEKLRQARTAAKQSRLDRSGVTTRMRGHVSARGQRAQGRRDSRG